MNELAIRPLRADPQQYFLSLVAEGRQLGMISDAQAERIGGETMALLAERTLRYTHGASASVRVETAQRLMASALYCIGHGLKALGSEEEAAEEICTVSVRVLYTRGRARVGETAAQARTQLRTVQDSRIGTENLAYNDTINSGLLAFFAGYDTDYGAHESPGSIDYPVRMPERCGIEYISMYLERVDMENRFCRTAGYSDALLRGYQSDGAGLLVNLFELQLGCCVGALLCGKGPADALLAEDAVYLGQRLQGLPTERLKAMLHLACTQGCTRLGIDEATTAYADKTLDALLPHIQAALRCGHPETVFIPAKTGIII